MDSLAKRLGPAARVVAIEGASSTGLTLLEFRSQFGEQVGSWDLRFALLYRNPSSVASVEFVGRDGPEPWPTKFPWHQRAAYRPHLRDLLPFHRAA